MGQQVFIHLQESGVLSRITSKVTSKDKYHPPCFLLLHPALYIEHDVTGCGIPLESTEASCPGSVPSSPNSLCTPSLLPGGVGEEP